MLSVHLEYRRCWPSSSFHSPPYSVSTWLILAAIRKRREGRRWHENISSTEHFFFFLLLFTRLQEKKHRRRKTSDASTRQKTYSTVIPTRAAFYYMFCSFPDNVFRALKRILIIATTKGSRTYIYKCTVSMR